VADLEGGSLGDCLWSLEDQK